MKCTEKGDHPLQINWTKNGVDLGNNNTYTVEHVTFDHAGLYECTAVNWAGKTNAFFWIDVTGEGNDLSETKCYEYGFLSFTELVQWKLWFSSSKLVHFSNQVISSIALVWCILIVYKKYTRVAFEFVRNRHIF